MQKSIPISELQKRSIFVATPMYGGQCHGMYAKSCVDLSMLAQQHGIECKFFYLFNESLITRARNYLVDEFLRSNMTHLMFIDSDISFNPNDVLALLALSEPGNDMPIIGAPYPKKCIAWERIAHAVKTGYADQDPARLERLVGDFVFNPAQGTNEIRLGEPVEVLETGTGFMMIQREALLKWKEAYPEFEYRPDHNRSEHFDGKRMIHAFFDTVICPDTQRYLSEDYMFCQWARKIGIKTWLCPWMETIHIGTYNFSGTLSALAEVPGATHGGLIDQEAAKVGYDKPQGAPLNIPAPPPAPPLSLPNIGEQSDELKNRAQRRREEMLKRKEERKKKKAASS